MLVFDAFVFGFCGLACITGGHNTQTRVLGLIFLGLAAANFLSK